MELPRSVATDTGQDQSSSGLSPLARMYLWWPTKMFGTIVGMGMFFVAYFWTSNNPLFPVTVVPATKLDRLIGFQPQALPLYLSLWFYVSLVPALIAVREELLFYSLSVLVLSVVGLGIFVLWPTEIERLEVDWVTYSSFEFLRSIDSPRNSCPSLHVAFAAYTAFWFDRILREMSARRAFRYCNWLWCAGIVYSTLAIRQHVVVDVIAGLSLGLMAVVANIRWLSKRSVKVLS